MSDTITTTAATSNGAATNGASNGTNNGSAPAGLDFEQPILTLEAQLRALEQTPARTPEQEEELRRVRREVNDTTRQIYGGLTPWQIVQVARHKDRPYTADYVSDVIPGDFPPAV